MALDVVPSNMHCCLTVVAVLDVVQTKTTVVVVVAVENRTVQYDDVDDVTSFSALDVVQKNFCCGRAFCR